MWSKPNFVPKWANTGSIITVKHNCLFRDCNDTEKLIVPKFTSVEVIEIVIGIKATSTTTLLLYPKHYSTIYKQLNPMHPCTSCGIMPKQRMRFSRYSSNATLVSKILTDLSGDEDPVSIRKYDYVCSTC